MIVEEAVYLDHHGVKGMKWGVRHDPGHEGQRVKTKTLPKLDQKWQSNIYSMHGAIAVHNATADRMNNGVLDKLNSDPKFKNAHLDHPDRPETKAYLKAYEKLVAENTAAAVKQVHGFSPSGTYKAKFDTSDPNNWRVVVSRTDVQHAAPTLPDLIFEVDHSNGKITQMAKVRESMTQSSEFDVEAFLSHHGVKGMHWGVRGTRRAQKTLDRTQRIATGTASVKDRLLGAAITKKGAQKKLQVGANIQARVNAGQKKTTNVMHTIAGVKLKELDFHAKGDVHGPTMTAGQKVVLGLIAANAAVNIAAIAAKNA